MTKLRVLDLFSGIGGFSLGLERTGGFETVAFCEIEDFPRRVLQKHWPGVPIYEDVTKLTGDILERDGIAVDVITGGFPCQDLSVAGKRAGIGEGTRSGLWSEIVRLIGELRPRYVIVENVANLLSGPTERRGGWFGRVLGDLAECGYDAEWENIPAASLGAPHRRERVWVVAYATEVQRNGGNNNAGKRVELGEVPEPRNSRRSQDVADAKRVRQSGQRQPIIASGCAPNSQRQAGHAFHECFGSIWRTEPDVGRVANGVPKRVDRLAGLGNAVVPQIPEMIGRAILETEAAL
jgi:DNA (cytosine-5)-methyltransferase 1